MSIHENIALFNSKINQTYWTDQVVNNHTIALLHDENYYKVLQKPYEKVGENSGTSIRYSTNNFAEYFACKKTEDTIAVVNSVKTEDSIPTKIAIATYYAFFDERENMRKIAILNRFDQTGSAHDNHLDVYGFAPDTKEFAFYKKYLSDYIVSDSGKERYKVKLPHVHFNTRSQTQYFRHHNKANAISIEKLIEYIKDLKSEMDPNALINRLDMGMPFLDLKNSKLTYSSTMLSSLREIIGFCEAEQRIRPSKFSEYEKETVNIMKSLINIDPDAINYMSIGSSSAGSSLLHFISSNTSLNSFTPVSKLKESDFEYILATLPPLNDLSLFELNEVKSHISKTIRQLDKQIPHKLGDQFYPQEKICETRELKNVYKSYLKYIKGLINLESASKDLKKYMMIYEVLNERDPLLMSFVSKELLKNLTANIKDSKEMEKGGSIYDSSDRQPL